MSRGRQRAELERLTAVLGGARGTGDVLVADWLARLRADPDGSTHATILLRGYRHGALIPERWAALTGRPPSEPSEIDDTLRRFWDAAAAADLVRGHSYEGVGTNRNAIRRWAWQPRWHLMQQDEDLLLMEDALIPTLLELTGERRLPKRDYILEIVAHHARDSCTHALFWGERQLETFKKVAAWAPAARVVGAGALASYLERLGSYARRGPVDRDAALQRLVDVARCHAPPPDKVQLVAADGGWEGLLLHSAGNKRIHIDAATGEMRHADAPPRPRRKR